MINSHLSDEQIAACAEAINAGNTKALSQVVKTHLDECNVCAQQVIVVSEIAEQINDVSESGALNRNYKSFYWLAAAALVVIMFALFLLTNSLTKKPTEVIVENITDSLQQENTTPKQSDTATNTEEHSDGIAEKLVLENDSITQLKKTDTELLAYATNADMEKLVDRFNNNAMRGGNFEVKTPLLLVSKPNKIMLEWSNPLDNQMIVEFFNNKGEKLFEKTISDSSYKATTISERGLYYWKLLDEEFDLIFCGKIKVQ